MAIVPTAPAAMVRSTAAAGLPLAGLGDHHSAGPAGHESAEGLQLAAQAGESVRTSSPCRPSAPARSYNLAAIDVDVTVNRFGDHDPEGRMYVLVSEIERVRAEEKANEAARRDSLAEPSVSIGLSGDAIQPLVIRVNAGDCLVVTLRNDLADQPASLHIHGSALQVVDPGAGPAIATNSHATAMPGQTVAYEWQVASDEPEGTHYFHSHGDAREQTGHGLFGALIVEPTGAEHLDPRTGGELRSGWDAVIRVRDEVFREFALLYHEIGDETYQLVDRAGQFVPLVDPLLGAYRPGSRALNYRSEPFMNRMALQKSLTGQFDESLAYSSYAFGDPATPVMRTYLGERTKQRVVHAGSEVFHVHHVHGGSVRWKRQPALAADAPVGLDKHPPRLPGPSERTDAQSIGPAETFDVENECGAGGCQQGAGDFLYHCHVAHHYFAGMWGIWRVYNTAQDGDASTDGLPPLAEVRGSGSDTVHAAVPARSLIGRTFGGGPETTLDAANLGPWVERQLPPRGIPRGYDASVLDWVRQGSDFLGEPEAVDRWPGYRPREPGQRPALLFDPGSGKLAYPFLRPHLGKRPPFAPGHGPAPFLDPPAPDAHDPPAPGASGPASVCPEGTRLREFSISAIPVPVVLNERVNLVDPDGEVFVLTGDAASVRADPSMRRPLAIRANAGEDCVDVVFRSELEDSAVNRGFAKVNAHIHFVQFDVQGSDGLTAGFNFEQSVRPYTIAGERVRSSTPVGAVELVVGDAARFQVGAVVGIGLERDKEFEARRIVAIRGTTLVLDTPFEHAHAAGEHVSSEFVRYRWYPDVQFGTAYFHDHVNGLQSWRHGLTGALIVEPPGSTYRDPTTGEEITSGPVADIHTEEPFGLDVNGSFREQAIFIQDDIPLTATGQSTGGTFNLRAEPLAGRGGDPALVFNSQTHGDPATPIARAFVGDPVVFRNLVSGTNEVHSWHLDGHWFRSEPHSPTSPPVNTINVGISERFDVAIPRAGGPQRRAGDYLFYSGRTFKLREGSWGILRVLEPNAEGLRPLPDHEPERSATGSVCPTSSPTRRFDVSAVEVPLPMLDGDKGRVFVLEADRASIEAERRDPEPFVVRATVGDCIEVRLTNRLPDSSVSFHTDLLAADPATSGGVAAGRQSRQAVDPGASATFNFYADPTVGPVAAMVRDMADADRNTAEGLYGAIIVAPKGATFSDPVTGEDLAGRTGWRADVRVVGERPYRDAVLFLQDEDPAIGTHRMPYTRRVTGVVGLNYRASPLGDEPGPVPPEASTPIVEARAGDRVRLHVLAPWSEQAHVFAVEGHRWPVESGRRGSDLVDAVQLGGLNALSLDFVAGPAGSYMYGDHREPYREAGLWGIFRVDERCRSALRPLGGECRAGLRSVSAAGGIGVAIGGAGLGAWALTRRRRRQTAMG